MGAYYCVLVYDVWVPIDDSRIYGGLADEKEGHRTADRFRVDAAVAVPDRGCHYASFGFLACPSAGVDLIA